MTIRWHTTLLLDEERKGGCGILGYLVLLHQVRVFVAGVPLRDAQVIVQLLFRRHRWLWRKLCNVLGVLFSLLDVVQFDGLVKWRGQTGPSSRDSALKHGHANLGWR